MSKIGSFKKVSGEYRGQIITLTLLAKSVRIVEQVTTSEHAPTHRIYAGEAEVGAGWVKTRNEDRPFLSIKLDDPSFTAPIFAQLFEGENGEHDLVLNRPPRRGAD